MISPVVRLRESQPDGVGMRGSLVRVVYAATAKLRRHHYLINGKIRLRVPENPHLSFPGLTAYPDSVHRTETSDGLRGHG